MSLSDVLDDELFLRNIGQYARKLHSPNKFVSTHQFQI